MSREATIFGTIVAIIFTAALVKALAWVRDTYPHHVLFIICGTIAVLGVGLGFLLDRKSAGR